MKRLSFPEFSNEEQAEFLWLVPYAAAYKHTKSGWNPPASLDHCANDGYSKEIWSEAEKRAKYYISNLSSHSNSLDSTARDMQLNQK